jgi:hypothetical protein
MRNELAASRQKRKRAAHEEKEIKEREDGSK